MPTTENDDEKKYYTSRTDLVFKTIMIDQPKVLERIIEEVTKEKLENGEILNSELPLTSIEVKSHRLDIIVQNGNKYLDLEMNNGLKNYTKLRNYLYLMDKMNNNVESGGKYSILLEQEYILINLNYQESIIEKRKEYIIREYYLQDSLGVYLKNIKVYDVNLDLLKKLWYDFSNKEKETYKYLYMLDLEKKELEEYTMGDVEMEKYTKKLNKLNGDKEFRDRISAEEDKLYCYNSDIDNAQKEGIALGKEEGITLGEKKAKIELAKNLLSLGDSIEKISKVTGLSKKEILDLKD